MGGSGPTPDWRDYPLNLEPIEYTSSCYDHYDYHEQLRLDSERLFGTDPSIHIRTIEFESAGR